MCHWFCTKIGFWNALTFEEKEFRNFWAILIFTVAILKSVGDQGKSDITRMFKLFLHVSIEHSPTSFWIFKCNSHFMYKLFWIIVRFFFILFPNLWLYINYKRKTVRIQNQHKNNMDSYKHTHHFSEYSLEVDSKHRNTKK